MKSVPAHALIVIGARQGEGVIHKRMAAVEGSVETGDLRRCREGLHRRFDAGNVVGLMERRKRDQGAQPREDRVVDQRRVDQVRPSVHDPMTDRGDRTGVPRLVEPAQYCAHGGTMVDGAVGWVERDVRLFAGRCLDLALGSRAETFDLASR